MRKPRENQFAGMTRTNCAAGCTAEQCVVSQKPYCAHPTKGGLQATDLGNIEAAERLQQAIKYLKRQAAA